VVDLNFGEFMEFVGGDCFEDLLEIQTAHDFILSFRFLDDEVVGVGGEHCAGVLLFDQRECV